MQRVDWHTGALAPDEYTRRTVRAFWQDGLWDFAVAGGLLMIGWWLHVLGHLIAFPTWAWPWPFNNPEAHIYPSWEVPAWNGAFFVMIAAYVWLAWKVVLWLKERWVAPHTGHVRHPFFLDLGPRFVLSYAGLFVVGLAVLGLLFTWLKGGPHLLTLGLSAAVSAVYLLLGRTYRLARYIIVSVLGLLINVALALTTRTASFHTGPTSWLEVDPLLGSPMIAALVLAVLLVASGVVGLLSVERGGHGAE